MSANTSHLKLDLNFLDDADKSEQLSDSNATIRPWVRFAARAIDNYIFAFAFALLILMFSPNLMPKSDLAFGFISLFIWIFVESILLSSWGTTFGKWLLNVCINDSEGQKLTFPAALQRSFLVWLKGMGVGLPLVCLFTYSSSHSDLTKKGITTWDKDCKTIISHKKIGLIRAVIASSLIAIFYLLYVLSLMDS